MKLIVDNTVHTCNNYHCCSICFNIIIYYDTPYITILPNKVGNN